MPIGRGLPSARPRIGRLAFQFGVAFALAMAAAGIGMFLLAKNALVAQVDQSLLRDRHRFLPEDGERYDRQLLAARMSSWEGGRTISDKGHALFDPTGRRVYGHISLDFPRPGFSDVVFRDGTARQREGRALTTRLPDGYYLVAVAHSEIVEDLSAILPPLGGGLLLAIISIGLIATSLLGRQIVARLSEIQRAADAIANGDLKRRVPTGRLDGVFETQADSFNRMLDRIEEVLRSQRQFTRNIAHDLRTPLTRLRGLLAEALADARDDDRLFIEKAERECKSIIAIFEALLRLSEIEAGRHAGALHPISLNTLIEDIAESIEPVLADGGRRLVLNLAEDIWIHADEGLITQLVVNLLDNIAVHTPAGTGAKLSLGFGEGDTVVLAVADDGPGLAAPDRVRVLQAFERGTSSGSVRGNGLGLAIAQAIVRFHNGELSLTDNRPGLVVEMRFPVVRPAAFSALPAAA